MTYAAVAHGYLRAGWRAPLPIPPNSKGPPPSGYTGFHAETPSPADVQTWCDTKPEFGVALRLPANVIGIDVDAYKDAGEDTLTDLEDELGALPPTAVSTSRDDGVSGIRFFRVPEAPSWKNPGPGVDIVHYGWRYAVVAPSVHPKTQTPYRWVTSRDFRPLPAEVSPPPLQVIPELPGPWVDFLRLEEGGAAKSEITDEALTQWLDVLPEGDPCPPVTETLEGFASELADPPKDRHDVMLDWVGRLMRAGEAGHAGVPEALHAMHADFEAAVGADRPTDGEFARAVSGALAMIEANPAHSFCACRVTILDGLGDATVVTEPLLASPETFEDDREPVDWSVVYEHLPVVDWFEAWDSDPEDIDWIVEGLIEAGRHAALYAGHKVGKSLMTLEVAAAVAAGDDEVLGCTIPGPRTVLYVDWENSRDDFVGRLKRLGRRPEELDRLKYLSFPVMDPLDGSRGGEQMLAAVKAYAVDWVVLDTFSRVVDGQENDSDTYRAYYRHTGVRLKERGVALWRLDHSGKDGSKGQRGSSAKGDDVDMVWALKRENEEFFRLTREVTRTLHGLDVLRLRRREDETRMERVDVGEEPAGPGSAEDHAMRREIVNFVFEVDGGEYLGNQKDLVKELGLSPVRKAEGEVKWLAEEGFLESGVYDGQKRKFRAVKPYVEPTVTTLDDPTDDEVD